MFAGSLVALAGLSFLGLGVPPGTPDWGLMLSARGATLLFVNPVAVARARRHDRAHGHDHQPRSATGLYERLSSRGATR